MCNYHWVNYFSRPHTETTVIRKRQNKSVDDAEFVQDMLQKKNPKKKEK